MLKTWRIIKNNTNWFDIVLGILICSAVAFMGYLIVYAVQTSDHDEICAANNGTWIGEESQCLVVEDGKIVEFEIVE